ncbi:MAG: RNA polymerase sigma factor [Thermoleophilia bacterium]|nr:RNA polymerase sigma factor [Thermoleophilia bacterium]
MGVVMEVREPTPALGPVEPDVEAIRRSVSDPEAFVAVFDRHFDAVHRYLHRRLGRDLADELCAEVFTRAFASRGRFTPHEGGALPWLYGIATNLVRRHRRTEERRLRAYARTGLDEAVSVDEDAVTRRADAGLLGPALAGALAALSREERDALCLVALADLTQEQAALALGVPLGTLSSRATRARSRLHALLPDHVHGTEER